MRTQMKVSKGKFHVNRSRRQGQLPNMALDPVGPAPYFSNASTVMLSNPIDDSSTKGVGKVLQTK